MPSAFDEASTWRVTGFFLVRKTLMRDGDVLPAVLLNKLFKLFYYFTLTLRPRYVVKLIGWMIDLFL